MGRVLSHRHELHNAVPDKRKKLLSRGGLFAIVERIRCPVIERRPTGKVEAFKVDGIECWFWSHDHRSPHFNAKRKGQWCVKVRFLLPRHEMLERAKGPRGRIRAADRKVLCDMAEAHRAELLAEWERKVQPDD